MPQSAPEGTPAGDKGPGSWALHIRGAARRTRCRVLQKVRVHQHSAQAELESPTTAAELIVIVVSNQTGEPVLRTFAEG
jgi:hypothetical protein